MAPFKANWTNADDAENQHPQAHNDLATRLNALSNVDNTADVDKPVSTAQAAADALKVGKGGDTMTGLLILPAGVAGVGGLRIGADVHLFRSAADILKSDDPFYVNGVIRAERAASPTQYMQLSGGDASSGYLTFESTSTKGLVINNNGVAGATPGAIVFQAGGVEQLRIAASGNKFEFGAALDTNLYRSAADTLKTDDAFQVAGTLTALAALTAFNGVGTSRSSAALASITSYISGEGQARYYIGADGKIWWGDGTLTQDTNLYRSAADTLRTDDALVVSRAFAGILLNVMNTDAAGHGIVVTSAAAGGASNYILRAINSGGANFRYGVDANGRQWWGDGTAAFDTTLYRSAADTLKTDDSLIVGTNLSVTGTSTLTGAVTASGLLDLAAGAANVGGLRIGTDVNLYRSGADTLATDDRLSLVRNATGPSLWITNPHATGYGVRVDLATAGYPAFSTRLTTDTQDRLQIDPTGVQYFGSGSAGWDTNLYRSAADTLKTDDSLTVGTNLSVTGTSTLTNLTVNGTLSFLSGATFAPQRGTETITAWASATSKSVTVTFPVAFSTAPQVFVNIKDTASVLPRTWTVRATSVTTTSFSINMFTVDTSSSAPTGDVKVDWLAVSN